MSHKPARPPGYKGHLPYYKLRTSNNTTAEPATLTQGIHEDIIIMNNILITHAFNTVYNSTKDPEIPDLFSWLRLYN